MGLRGHLRLGDPEALLLGLRDPLFEGLHVLGVAGAPSLVHGYSEVACLADVDTGLFDLGD